MASASTSSPTSSRSVLAENRINPGKHLYRWQRVVFNLIMDQEERTILFVVDPTGNRGKTFLAQYMWDVLPSATHVTVTLERPRHFGITGAPTIETVVFDYGRGVPPVSFAWNLMKNLKAGISPNGMGHYKKPVKVAVFTNIEPTLVQFDQLRGLGSLKVVLMNLDKMFEAHGQSMFDFVE